VRFNMSAPRVFRGKWSLLSCAYSDTPKKASLTKRSIPFVDFVVHTMPLHELIADAVENIEPAYDLGPLFRACKEEPDIHKYRNDLWALHHSSRAVLNDPVQIEGDITSESVVTFLLATLAEKIVDDPRTFGDFPLIKFHPKWDHPADKDIPISRQSQQVVVDALFGLDWFIFCDLFNEDHSRDMIEQARTMFMLLRNRICHFIHSHHMSKSILNMDIYHDLEKAGLYSKPDTAAFDYDSDDEIYKQRTAIVKNSEEYLEKDVEVAFVNAAFVYDMEAYISFFHQQFMLYDTSVVEDAPQVSLSRFRGKLFELVSSLDKKFLVQKRVEWQVALEVHETHYQVHKNHHGLTIKPKPRQVIVTKNDGLVLNSTIRSFEDIVTRDVEFTAAKIRLSTDAMFWAWTLQNDNIVSKLNNKLIWRDRLRGHWVIKARDRLFKVKSFTHGFFALRDIIGQEGDFNLAAYDALL
jgi:hypothetical protein